MKSAPSSRKNVRKVDLAARYGGDEFIILLPATDKQGALIMANHLHRKMQEHLFLSADGPGMRVTASFGIANFPADADSQEDLVRLADLAMYRAKERRNSVCAA